MNISGFVLLYQYPVGGGDRFYQVSVRVQDFQQFAIIGKVWQTISYISQLENLILGRYALLITSTIP